ncbi:MAG TPA: hypothetical protein VN939_23490 [Chthoniobacterales bacterium]|jgi:hypothetical protein|nr:hypothetical protein [Chthoniobacterales bacterium]
MSGTSHGAASHGVASHGIFGGLFGGHQTAASHTVASNPGKSTKAGNRTANLDPATHSPFNHLGNHHHVVTQSKNTGGVANAYLENKKKLKGSAQNGSSESSVTQR